MMFAEAMEKLHEWLGEFERQQIEDGGLFEDAEIELDTVSGDLASFIAEKVADLD